MKTITLLIILSISIKTMSLGDRQGFTGGWSVIDKESLDDLGIEPFLKNGIKITSGYQQVVSGINYVLSIQDGSKNQAECGICLYFVPWMNKLEVLSCVETERDGFLKYEFDHKINECEQSVTKDSSNETKMAEVKPVEITELLIENFYEIPAEKMSLVDQTSK